MKTPFENREFCRETFEGALPEGFREGAIAGMARAARRKRQTRQSGMAIMGLLMAGLALTMVGRRSGSPEESVLAGLTEASWVVRSAQLPAEMIVSTDVEARFELISDEQLLALAGERSIGLIRVPEGSEVVFLESLESLVE